MSALPDTDVAVVGAGPAGLAAALVCAQAGAETTVFERDAWTGGKLGIQTQPLQGPATIFSGESGSEYMRRLTERADLVGAAIRLGADVIGLKTNSPRAQGYTTSGAPSFTLSVRGLSNAVCQLSARAVILATGSDEPVPAFPGADLPGVMRSGDAQVALNVGGRLVGERVVMVGSDNSGLLIARNLMDAGATVIALLEEGPSLVGRDVNVTPIRQAGTDVLMSTRVVSAIGEGKLEAVRAETLYDSSPGRLIEIECDTLCLASPRVPDSVLALGCGCPAMEFAALGGSVPVHDRSMTTPVPGLSVCGDGSGVENGAVALESGTIAGLSTLGHLGLRHPCAAELAQRARGRLGHLRRGARGAIRRQAKERMSLWSSAKNEKA